MKKKHGAHKHMEKAMHHMEQMHMAMKGAKKAMGKLGSAGEEMKMAKKGDKKGSKYP